MKPLRITMLVLLLSLTTAASYSQASGKTRPAIFSKFPNTIECSQSQLSKAFAVYEGQHVVFSFSNNFTFSGTVISNIVKYSNLQSMVIQSDDSKKTVFHLSKQINADKSVSFVGRILNPEAADGFRINGDEAGNYKFEKIESEKILQPCNL